MKRGPKKSINGVEVGHSGISTRQMILDKASELINDVGMSEFRVDTLAASLELSPGNITYHFPRKEDIGNAIWMNAVQDITASLDHYISPLLDIKQLFLFYKYVVSTIYKHRGTFMPKLGDTGLIKRNAMLGDTLKTVNYAYDKKVEWLKAGGYIDLKAYAFYGKQVFESQVTCLGWWLTGLSPEQEPAMVSDKYAIMLITLMEPVLSDKGLRQLSEIYSLVGHK
ncbi:MAG: TetR/AcrR family transcriptional regulator [Rikenellaceae bacterium]|nr:TetR/AcrR family transcriptional regulator [Rikenellaceae bacterium]MDE7356717.1 TetR/AcrR family transcriptional regulator [Rikenellaceae bacterium]